MAAVYLYAEPITTRGFVFMDTPGYDPVSMTGLVTGGCNIVVFTTGRGSVYGCKPAPCIKVATNTTLYNWMAEDMDINCGIMLEGTPIATVGRRDLRRGDRSRRIGKRSKSELSGARWRRVPPWIVEPVMSAGDRALAAGAGELGHAADELSVASRRTEAASGRIRDGERERQRSRRRSG